MSAVPSPSCPLFPELGSPPTVPTPSAVLLQDCSHIIIAPKGAWSIVLKPSYEGLIVTVKRRNAENRYDDVYTQTSAVVTERSVTRLVTSAVGHIVTETLRQRGVDCTVSIKLRECVASILVRRDNRIEPIVEVCARRDQHLVRVGKQLLPPLAKDTSFNMNLFLGTATLLSTLN